MRYADSVIDCPVSLQLTRCSGSADFFRLTIEDKLSGILILEVRIDPDKIADLLTTRFCPGTGKYFSSPNIGKKMEGKEVLVDRKDGWGSEIIQSLLEEAEQQNPGWVADHTEWSSHRVAGKFYKVWMRRWIDE